MERRNEVKSDREVVIAAGDRERHSSCRRAPETHSQGGSTSKKGNCIIHMYPRQANPANRSTKVTSFRSL